MADTSYWPQLIKSCTDEMLRVAQEAERNVYDYLVPMLMERGTPDEREAFFNGIDFEKLKTLSPYLWERYTGQALSLQNQRQQRDDKALADLRDYNRERGFEFRRMVAAPDVFGLRTTNDRQTTITTGMDIPMGSFSP